VYAFAEVMRKICAESHEKGLGTDWRNAHPICRLYAEQIMHLTKGTDYFQADKVCREEAKKVQEEGPAGREEELEDLHEAAIADIEKRAEEYHGREWEEPPADGHRQLKLSVSKVKMGIMGMEGQTYSLLLHVDGKAVADVSDHGDGGGLRYHWRDRADELSLLTAVRKLCPRNRYPSLDLDCLVEEALNDHRMEQQLKRWCAKNIVLKFPDTQPEEFCLFKLKRRPTQADIAAYEVKHPNAEVVNRRFE
jgi:hypothetical protein